MRLVLPFDSTVMPLAFYLAQEEWLSSKYPASDFFFIWQVKPTVIIGRNQLLESEVNVGYCRKSGIDIVRRKSGGGAVLADMNNIMFSYITPSDDVTTTFSAYTSMVASSLRMLGLDASDNSRNDILIGGRKVSGNSFYHLPGRSIVHGTMLYDFDAVMMGHALTPPAVKLQSHGVTSVRSRITTIREHLPSLGIGEFMEHVIRTIPDDTDPLRLTAADVGEIKALEREYYRPGWLTGKNPKGTLCNTRRIDGVGSVSVHVTVSKGLIREALLSGDYLELTDASGTFSKAVVGLPYEREAVGSALSGLDTAGLVPGLTPSHLMELIF